MVTVDTKALHHVLKDGYLYEKSDQIRHDLGAILGTGLLFVTGEDHKRQRKTIVSSLKLFHTKFHLTYL